MPPKTKTKKIGLALSGGGARGIAHIGVLQVFEENKIPIHTIAGTSFGAFVGGAYSVGTPLKKLTETIEKISHEKIVTLSNINFFNESILRSEHFADFVRELVGTTQIEKTAIPFTAIATDLEGGQEVQLHSGPLVEAILASTAFPPLLPPVFLDNKYLIDGGLLNLMPADVLRSQVDVVVGVELPNYTSQQFISGMIYDKFYRKGASAQRSILKQWELNLLLMGNIIMRTVDIASAENLAKKRELAQIDVLISPKVESFSFFGFKDFEKIIAVGRTAAEAVLPKLKKLL